MRVLITGVAGFIGSHLADELINHGYEVVGLDNLDPQVHGEDADLSEYLNPKVQFIQGDVGHPEIVDGVLDVDAVVHLAAKVGVGQSAYQMWDYVNSNSVGTASFLESLPKRSLRKLIVASSMSVYGEGAVGSDADRPPLATSETKPPDLQSIYALTKYDQERMCLLWGRAFNIPTIALRFFNVYGTRQSLSNPYTGVIAIFASRLLNNHSPIIFEDGQQRRDFVHVSDIVRGIRQALESDISDEVINLGSGTNHTVLQIAEKLTTLLGKDILPVITGQHRVGDIRHCFADITKARRLLSYEPQVTLDQGLAQLVPWLKEQTAVDKFDKCRWELAEKGLLK